MLEIENDGVKAAKRDRFHYLDPREDRKGREDGGNVS
jgi:hypothetical protein